MPAGFLPYPLDRNNAKFHQDLRCFSQSRAFNTAAVQNGRPCGCIYKAECVNWISYRGRHQSDRNSKTSKKYAWWGRHVTSDTRYITLRAVRRTLVTGPTEADQPRQQWQKPETKLTCWYGMTPASWQQGSGNQWVWPSSDVLQVIMSLNTVCIKRSDASAKGFMQPAHSVSHIGGTSLFIMKQSLWENNLNFAENVCMIRTFHYNCDYSLRKNRKHYFCNALHTLFKVWKET